MFGKLLKYEFKAAGKLYGVLFLILAIVSSIFGLMLSNSISSGITSDDAVSAVYSFFTIVFFSTCTALVISNLVITIRRFYQNIFGREAYLTWTLPANAHQIIKNDNGNYLVYCERLGNFPKHHLDGFSCSSWFRG